MAQSLSPQTNQNSALGSDPDVLHLKTNNREVLMAVPLGYLYLSY